MCQIAQVFSAPAWANEIREIRSAIARKEKAKEAGKVKPLSNQRDNSEDTSSPKLSPTKESTSRTRAAVAKEANLPERKLRAAQELKAKAPELSAKVRARKQIYPDQAS